MNLPYRLKLVIGIKTGSALLSFKRLTTQPGISQPALIGSPRLDLCPFGS